MDSTGVVRIKHGLHNELGEAVMAQFNQWCNQHKQRLLELGDGVGDELSLIEFEGRMGVYNDDLKMFVPGVSQSFFGEMLKYFKGRVGANNWYRADNREKLVGYSHTAYVDVIFEDNVRVTTRLNRSNPQRVDSVDIIEVISKRKVGKPKDFKVDAPRYGTRYHLRLGVSAEETVPEGSEWHRSHVHMAKKAIMDAYNVSTRVKILGGIDLRLKDSVEYVFLTFPPEGEEAARGGMGALNDPIYYLADMSDGKMDGKLAKQLKWTLLEPARLPSLGGGVPNPVFDGKRKMISNQGKVMLTNAPGSIILPDGTEHVAYACQYIVEVLEKHILCGHGRFAGENDHGDGDGGHHHTIKSFRLKNRWSFTLRANQKLDMTETRTSSNLAALDHETPVFEVEIEKQITYNGWKDKSPEQLSHELKAVSHAESFLADIASRMFGVALPPLALDKEPSHSPWKQLQEKDKERIATFLQEFGKGNSGGGGGGPSASSSAAPSSASANRKRKLSMDEDNTDQRGAADFYNRLDRSSHQARHQSLIYHMRCLNNYVKSVVIREAIGRIRIDCLQNVGGRDIAVLDLACGKGADLQKFMRGLGKGLSISNYVGVDIARVSLDDAVDRLSSVRNRNFRVRFVEADLGMHSISAEEGDEEDFKTLSVWDSNTNAWDRAPPSRIIGMEEKFHLISMQFAFHYMFQKSSRAHHFFKTISRHVAVGGVFIGCTVCADEMVRRLMEAGPDANSFSIVDQFGVEACKVEFDPAFREKCFSTFKPKDEAANSMGPGTTEPKDPDFAKDMFGVRYDFTLRDGEDDSEQAVAAPEWLIPIPLLRKLAAIYHFKVVRYERLPNAAMRNMTREAGKPDCLYKRMNVLNFQGSISKVEWDIASLYVVVELQKESPPQSTAECLSRLRERIPEFNDLDDEERSFLLNTIKKTH